MPRKQTTPDFEKQAEAILSSIGEGIFVVNKKLRITAINAPALRLLHKHRASCINKPYWRVTHIVDNKGEETTDEIRLVLRKMIHAAETHKEAPQNILRAYIRLPHGGIIPVAFNVAVLQSAYGTVMGGVVTIRDITHEVEIDTMKTEFVSIASHQLSAPLAAIRWNIEMLLNGDAGPISPEQQTYLADVLESDARMIRLVNDLLNVSRLEQGKIVVTPKPVNLKSLLDDLLFEYKHYIASRGCDVKVIVDVGGIEPVVTVDPTLVRQMFNNLVVNAVQYASFQHGNVVITIRKSDIDYLISVWDNGIGIPQEAQRKIFTKFFRADNAQTREAIGTGLGLYITKLLVELSGGKIWFTSDAAEGTIFYFTLPLEGSQKHSGERSIV